MDNWRRIRTLVATRILLIRIVSPNNRALKILDSLSQIALLARRIINTKERQ
jgi:hypothetical protein